MSDPSMMTPRERDEWEQQENRREEIRRREREQDAIERRNIAISLRRGRHGGTTSADTTSPTTSDRL